MVVGGLTCIKGGRDIMSSKLLTNITAIKSLKKFIDLEASKAKRAKSQLLPKANFTDNTSKFSFFVELV